MGGMPCAVLWRPGALDCRVLIPPEAWNGLTRTPPPHVGIESRTSCIWEPTLLPTELSEACLAPSDEAFIGVTTVLTHLASMLKKAAE